jgi:hypothetical protein
MVETRNMKRKEAEALEAENATPRKLEKLADMANAFPEDVRRELYRRVFLCEDHPVSKAIKVDLSRSESGQLPARACDEDSDLYCINSFTANSKDVRREIFEDNALSYPIYKFLVFRDARGNYVTWDPKQVEWVKTAKKPNNIVSFNISHYIVGNVCEVCSRTIFDMSNSRYRKVKDQNLAGLDVEEIKDLDQWDSAAGLLGHLELCILREGAYGTKVSPHRPYT